MTNEQKIIATKLGLLRLAERLGNMSEACKVMCPSLRACPLRKCEHIVPAEIR
jgi:hypothetical protein